MPNVTHVPQLIATLSHNNSLLGSQSCTSSHKQSDLDESPEVQPEDIEEFTEWILWIFQGFLFFSSNGCCILCHTAQMKLKKLKSGQWWNSNVYLKFLSLSSTWKFLQFYGQTGQRCLKLPIWGYVHVNFISQWQCRKCIGAAVLQWAKVHGCIQCNKWYLMNTQDTDLENTRRLLLRHGQNLRVNGQAWTFSGTVCVDPLGD